MSGPQQAALVTGAASGIGRAVATRLAAEGVRVGVCDVDRDGAEQVAGELDGAFPVPADLGEAEQCRQAVDTVVAEAGRIDILVNNAGLQKVAPLPEFPDESWDRLLAVILSAAFHTSKRALPHMYERGFGRIVNVSSMLGQVGEPYKAAYVSAKHGLHGLTKVIALEGAERGVTCNAVCPAYVRTPWLERTADELAASHGLTRDEVVARIMLKEPAIKRLAEADEVAGLVAFLCSEGAAFMTGAEYRIDGAFGAR
ncbi:MAG TPA: 3-hydroxybutyrate dehydrogenase [Baekduia sp.]|nr:3-hydroxybutyrate dehydrogenase [Baekduia sp.]